MAVGKIGGLVRRASRPKTAKGGQKEEQWGSGEEKREAQAA